MRLLGNLILRLIAIFLGVLIALAAASIFLSIGLFGGFFREFFTELNLLAEGDGSAIGSLIALAVVFTGFVSSFHVIGVALLPATIAIAVTELMRWQGMITYLVLGELVGLFAGISTFAVDHDGLPSDGTLIVLLATGFIGGFFYWLIAGRGAGTWLPERRSEPIDVMDKLGRNED